MIYYYQYRLVILLDFSECFFLYACQPWTDRDFIDNLIKTQWDVTCKKFFQYSLPSVCQSNSLSAVLRLRY
jgi:hypothetical protein